MVRQMIHIDQELCIGCGLCANACQEGAIGMKDGKAVLMREDYCDGLGNCLPVCPTGAISFVTREAPAFDHEGAAKAAFSCPGTQAKVMDKKESAPVSTTTGPSVSQLRQWPVQINLASPNASFFENCDLLIAADCSAYAFANFHNTFMKDKVTLIGCPKLDAGDYAEKLSHIIGHNNIRSVTVARMEVPCCGGLESAVKRAIAATGKIVPLAVVTISTDGEILS